MIIGLFFFCSTHKRLFCLWFIGTLVFIFLQHSTTCFFPLCFVFQFTVYVMFLFLCSCSTQSLIFIVPPPHNSTCTGLRSCSTQSLIFWFLHHITPHGTGFHIHTHALFGLFFSLYTCTLKHTCKCTHTPVMNYFCQFSHFQY